MRDRVAVHWYEAITKEKAREPDPEKDYTGIRYLPPKPRQGQLSNKPHKSLNVY